MNSLEAVRFADGGTALTGWVRRPRSGTPRGAVLIFPTIANRNPAMDRRAAMLADAGYIAMIADFYGEEVSDFEAAQRLGQRLRADVSLYRNRLFANVNTFSKLAGALPKAIFGYCMGGQAALETARAGAEVAAVASFHGLLTTDASADREIAPRLLICHGDADPMVPRDQVSAFQHEMDAVGARWTLIAFSGAKHGFTDPASDTRDHSAVAYDTHADRLSWAAAMALLEEEFLS